MKKKLILNILLMSLSAFILSGCGSVDYPDRESLVMANVTSKDMRFDVTTKSTKGFVTLEYNNMQVEFKNSNLYNLTEIGSQIQVIYEEYYDDYGNFQKANLELIN